MGISSLGRTAGVSVVVAVLLTGLAACDRRCGLGEHDRVTVSGPPVTAAVYQDVSLKGETSGAEFSLSNTAFPTQPPGGGVDAYLVPTSCAQLFDGPYPGAAPLCKIYLGPARPGGVTGHAKLTAGRYRVYLQTLSNVSGPVNYLVDVYIWDYSCRALIQ